MEKTDKRAVLRAKSFALPVLNPFTHELELTFAQKVKVALMSVSIAPIRLVLLSLFLVLTWIVAKVATFGMRQDSGKPVSSWRRAIIQVVAALGRFQFFIMGFLWVEIKGKRAPTNESRLLVAAPHSSMFDTLLWFCTPPLPSSVSRVENAQAYLFGTLVKTLQPVLVSRQDPQSRQKAIQEIHHRATSDDDWPQIGIFPEGTCTNRKALITFKAGAFIPGDPIQPVILKYPGHLDTYTWTMNGPGAMTLLWLSLCQIYNKFEVEFLPVYHPSEKEKASPRLYASNVRNVMAQALGIPSTDHTFEDCRLMYHAKSRDLPLEAGLIEFSKLSRKLGMNIDEMRDILDEFATISRSCKDGLMGIEEFGEHLNLPLTDALKDLFALYDRTGSGFIDFREYVIGMSLVSQAAVTEKTVKLAFRVFDRDGDGLISRNELDHILKSVFGPEFEAGSIWDKIDPENKGNVDYERFYSFAKKRPEYAKVFMSYADLEQDDIPRKLHSTQFRQRRTDQEPICSRILNTTSSSTSHTQKPLRDKTD